MREHLVCTTHSGQLLKRPRRSLEHAGLNWSFTTVKTELGIRIVMATTRILPKIRSTEVRGGVWSGQRTQWHFLVSSLESGLLRTPIFKHLVLRTCLSLEGAIPFRYARFLKYVTDLSILEQEGGQWRFRHPILQAHFASATPQTIQDE